MCSTNLVAVCHARLFVEDLTKKDYESNIYIIIWTEIFIKQSVGKCKQINFYNFRVYHNIRKSIISTLYICLPFI